MPKIIEDLPLRLSEEARRQVEQSGYSALTIRSVAKSCGIGVGTVYNYFPSKESLVASYMLRDWDACYTALLARCADAAGPETVLRAIYEQLLQFLREHAELFRDEAAQGSFPAFYGLYHSRLRQGLAAPLRPFCPDDFTAAFLAQALLNWTMEGQNFETLYPVLAKIIA